MNFRTSYLVGLIATGIVAIAAPSIHSATAAEPLKITGPDGQVKSNIQTNAQVNQSDPQGVRQYGPTTSADTFWSIAQAVKPDNSVTVYQVMSALFDANPHAFSSKNYNSLERGMILLVPSKSVMQQMPAADAKARAENNDQRWSSSSVVAQPRTPAKVVPATNTVSSNGSSKSNPLIAELSEEVKSLTAQVESIQAKNLELTDELARASDEIVVGSSDTAAFQDEISQLKQENALLKQALQEAKAETAALEQEIKVSQQQIAAATEPQSEPTSNLWRTIMDNPLLLVLGAVLPAIIVIGIFWLFLRRKKEPVAKDSTAEQQAENGKSDDKPVNNAESKTDDADDMAVHLDTDSGADDLPLKEIAAAGAVGLAVGAVADEQDIVVEDSQDDGQSLDDLWAEAMGEQDQADSLDGFETNTSKDDDDLDSLLAGFDEPETQAQDTVTRVDAVNTDDDDLDALLAGFDEPETQAQDTVTRDDAVNTDDDDLDALLAGFDEPEAQAQDAVTRDDTVNTDDDDLDALLAGFDEPETQAKDTVSRDDAVNTDDDDIDALLAGFDEPETQTKDTVSRVDAVNTDDDLDALLAGFDEPEAQAQDAVTRDDTVNTDDDLDALFAGFDESEAQDTVTSDNTAVEINDTTSVTDDDELEALLASLENDSNDAEPQQDIDSLSDEMAAELALGFEIAAELEDEDNTEQQKLDSELDSEIDALLAEFDMPSGSESPEITGGIDNTDSAEETTKFDPNEIDDLELATTANTLEPVTELEPELEAETETQSFTAESSESDLSSDVGSIEFDNINFSRADQDSETVDSDKLGSESEQDFLTRELQEAAAQQEQAKVAKQADIDAFLAPKTELESTEVPQVSEKESGFFDDLKADNQTTDNSLDWESISAPQPTPADNEVDLDNDNSFNEKDNNLEALNSDFDIAAATELTDEELLSNLAQAGDVEDNSLDLSDDTFTLDSDSKMTVDEALAALDAEEYVEHKPNDEATEQQDLSNFQRDNGFIDIDMLLSEADEDNGETDLYKQFDVDMGELNSLMGNSSMVDVDDEENSVNAKLDLARAYIEIDDNDSARALLKEVELDGNDRQQAEAVGLLKELV
ncbi:pilus assembly protein FimV [Shewanella sp. 1CM18E]|uniref:FimV/HubP family polar landmark protein n=1 Tax=Shewanella sp. 1CM18E TaxID=2929169 RepID=UPI0020BE8DAF|nr:FimV/HubP family polar landmark protein [Shewanella sp. 1CM18E]MCK8044028.1 pilus assembly protein FimV [Shewanella sp. 1CM18E]